MKGSITPQAVWRASRGNKTKGVSRLVGDQCSQGNCKFVGSLEDGQIPAALICRCSVVIEG